MNKINILGTTYTIKKSNAKKDSSLVKADGYIDTSTKTIVLADLESEKNDYNALDNMEKYADKVFRHELIHAFLFESGLACYGSDEKIVDWIAAQYPKLKEVFERLKI